MSFQRMLITNFLVEGKGCCWAWAAYREKRRGRGEGNSGDYGKGVFFLNLFILIFFILKAASSIAVYEVALLR